MGLMPPANISLRLYIRWCAVIVAATFAELPSTNSTASFVVMCSRIILREANFSPEDYERLLQLDNAISSGPKPATESQITSCPVHKFSPRRASDDSKGDSTGCVICLQNYVKGDERRTLPCKHMFCVDCIDKWLRLHNSCPICKTPITITTGN